MDKSYTMIPSRLNEIKPPITSSLLINPISSYSAEWKRANILPTYSLNNEITALTQAFSEKILSRGL